MRISHGQPSPCARCRWLGRASPGGDVAGESRVTVQMWPGWAQRLPLSIASETVICPGNGSRPVSGAICFGVICEAFTGSNALPTATIDCACKRTGAHRAYPHRSAPAAALPSIVPGRCGTHDRPSLRRAPGDGEGAGAKTAAARQWDYRRQQSPSWTRLASPCAARSSRRLRRAALGRSRTGRGQRSLRRISALALITHFDASLHAERRAFAPEAAVGSVPGADEAGSRPAARIAARTLRRALSRRVARSCNNARLSAHRIGASVGY